MSDEIALAAADRAAEIAAIRARWAGVAWHYTENMSAAQLYTDNDPGGTITLAPVKRQRITLRLAAQAPADIAALLGRITMLAAALDAIERAVNASVSGVQRVPIEEWTALLAQAQAALDTLDTLPGCAP